MRFVGRSFRIIFSLMLAIAVSTLFLPVAVFMDPLVRNTVSNITPDIIEFFLLPLVAPQEMQLAITGIIRLLWVTSLAICVVPIIMVAMIGELARVKSFVWYVFGTGLLAGSMPWIVRVARGTQQQANPLTHQAELRIALLFCLTGLTAGLVYWLAAGRSTGERTVRG